MHDTDRIECDLLIVGGGINGAGIARDAAGRGLSVVLCEKDDLAAHTSSASTKLIHGGLRYLEHYEFGLVRKALIEREVLLRSAPHIMHPLRFVMPHDAGQRPAWMIRAGMLLYDLLARREILPGSHGVDLKRHAVGKPLKRIFRRGFVYSDGWVDDARLVALCAVDAHERGARILTHTECLAARVSDGVWQADLRDAQRRHTSVRARALVNASGPWAAQFLQQALGQGTRGALRQVKGSHIVVKRMFDHPYAYIFQHPDGRIVFAIPYERDFTLVGTTDINYDGDLDHVRIASDEIDYLCQLANHYFHKPLRPEDVVWSYSGVRPLLEDPNASAQTLTRDYHLELEDRGAPLLSVFGGKITTFRKLAEQAVDQLAPLLGNQTGAWTARQCLPGGDLYGPTPRNRAVLEFERYVSDQQQQLPWLPPELVLRWVRAYGTRLHQLLSGAQSLQDLGAEVAPGLYEAELRYLREHEFATRAVDVLWRRSKLGLHLPTGVEAVLDAWFARQVNTLDH